MYAGGKLYKLSDKKLAMKHIGYEVEVKGTLRDDGSVDVVSITKAKEDV